MVKYCTKCGLSHWHPNLKKNEKWCGLIDGPDCYQRQVKNLKELKELRLYKAKNERILAKLRKWATELPSQESNSHDR